MVVLALFCNPSSPFEAAKAPFWRWISEAQANIELIEKMLPLSHSWIRRESRSACTPNRETKKVVLSTGAWEKLAQQEPLGKNGDATTHTKMQNSHFTRTGDPQHHSHTKKDGTTTFVTRIYYNSLFLRREQPKKWCSRANNGIWFEPATYGDVAIHGLVCKSRTRPDDQNVSKLSKWNGFRAEKGLQADWTAGVVWRKRAAGATSVRGTGQTKTTPLQVEHPTFW